jgi:hypothetical protein
MSRRPHFSIGKHHNLSHSAETAFNGLIQGLKILEKVADAIPVPGLKPTVSGLLQTILLIKVRIHYQ